MQQILNLIKAIKPALLRHLTGGIHGGDFAGWMAEGFEAEYTMLRTVANRNQIYEILTQTIPEVAQFASINQPRLLEFIDEFLAGPLPEEEGQGASPPATPR